MSNYQFHTYAQDALVFDPNTGNFVLRADYDYATDRNLVQYSDDDSQLDGDEDFNNVGDDANQVGTAYDDAGNVIASGTVYTPQFAEVQAPDGTILYFDRIEVDGVHVGYISSGPVQPGTAYAVTDSQVTGATASNGSSNTVSHSYYEANSVPCFAAGTLIDTAQGLLPVETVKIGMGLRLPDGSCATVMWRRASTVRLTDAVSALHPVLISKNAIAPGQPRRDLVVSAQHRILVGHPRQWRQVSGGPALLPARALLGQPGIRVMRGRKSVTWVHLACRGHHVINVQGCLTETMLLGPTYMRSLPAMERLRVAALFAPVLATDTMMNGPPAYPCLSVQDGRRLMATIRVNV